MSKDQYQGPPAHFVNAKRVSTKQDKNGREVTKLTFGTYTTKNGEVNTADQLIEVLSQYQGKQFNLEVRTEAQENGYDRAYVRVTEMIPKNQTGTATFTKKPTKQDQIRASSKKFQNGVE